MADPRYPDVDLTGMKQDAALPDLQLQGYRGENAAQDQGQMAMTPQQRKVMAYIQALKQRRMMEQGGAQMPQGMAPQAPQGGQMPPQGMPPQY